jgi:hypothetical protein
LPLNPRAIPVGSPRAALDPNELSAGCSGGCWQGDGTKGQGERRDAAGASAHLYERRMLSGVGQVRGRGNRRDSLDFVHPGSIEGEAELLDTMACPRRSAAASWSGGLILQVGVFSVHAKTMLRQS